MIYYAVIDTNVIVSAMLSPYNDAATVVLMNKVFCGDIIPVFNNEILDEYANVLNRDKFGFDKTKIATFINAFKRLGVKIDATSTGVILPDSKDLPFYEVTITARKMVDAFLVTGNIRHFIMKPYILTPKEMLLLMESIS